MVDWTGPDLGDAAQCCSCLLAEFERHPGSRFSYKWNHLCHPDLLRLGSGYL